ncbi:TPA: hypothetical protein OT248_004583 [Klebsiella pneumoniae]|uniref:hypothetical protein n=1 Tax=Enterobacteriaceae TaxID=543 RepID=UPI0003EE82E7|nr:MULTISPECIES: hypothetical protein [Enterobacteriaceae]HEA0732412.1 hypothetical protein [Escherichia coli]MBY8354698.1 hypothetical protein [Klebsiella pneumoniae]MCD5816879.1 hypothetical protein [Klebsiella pneumoniae]HBV4844894.1 hypothetical protein [Klebsiella pneumoniae]HCF8084403.1 hypothetical protein [Klebsiella pneumoniae]
MSIKELSITHDRGFNSDSKISEDLTLRRTLLFVIYSIIPVIALYYFSPYLAEATINSLLSVGIEIKYGLFLHFLATWFIFWGAVTIQHDFFRLLKKIYKKVSFSINKKGQ